MADLRIGFTGAQKGMTAEQTREVDRLLGVFMRQHTQPGGLAEFHHGDCVGSDEQADELAYRHGYYIVLHPPDSDKKRAWTTHYDMSRMPKPYLVRNREIVHDDYGLCDWMIATPGDRNERQRSGTWATIRYARKHTALLIVYPDGDIAREGQGTAPQGATA